mgnify:CR=1 FL=1
MPVRFVDRSGARYAVVDASTAVVQASDQSVARYAVTDTPNPY